MSSSEKSVKVIDELRHIDLPEQSIYDTFAKSASKYASHTAVIDGDQYITFAELKDTIEYLATSLYHKGFKKWDRLALMVPNSLAYITTYFAVQRLGGIIVQVNPMYQPQELEHILKDSEATWFFGYEKEKVKLQAIDGLQAMEEIYIDGQTDDSFSNLIKEKEKDLPETEIDINEDVAVFQYTGGTTGLPKGAMLTHANIVKNIHQTYYHLEDIYSQPNHRLLGSAPMYHAMGMTNMFLCLTIGGTFIAVARFRSNTAIELIRKHKPTLFLGSPTMYIALLNDDNFQPGDLKSFKLLVCGSAPMPVEVIKQVKQETDAVFAEGYGLSEATTSTHRNPGKGKKKPGSIGIPVPNTQAMIVDVDGGENEMPGGQSGELIVKGPQVMKGYWNNSEETAIAKRGNWLYTGDIAVKDEDGYYYIVGRKKDMIVASGFNIYPVEIENVIYEHPSVQEACVFGVPDPYRGETVKVAIVKKEPITEEDIINWCEERLAKYKVPKIIEFREELPKTTVGKILRRRLVEEEQNK